MRSIFPPKLYEKKILLCPICIQTGIHTEVIPIRSLNLSCNHKLQNIELTEGTSSSPSFPWHPVQESMVQIMKPDQDLRTVEVRPDDKGPLSEHFNFVEKIVRRTFS